MQRYKSFVLPLALIAGYLLRQICAVLSVTVPFVIFLILVLTFSGVRLSSLRPARLDFRLAGVQAIASIGVYYALSFIISDSVLAQGAMMCILCPVASSVTVVSVMLGANPVRTTTYTIVGNLLVAILAPVYISLIDSGPDESLWHSLCMIFSKISWIIALPFFVMWLLQKYLPEINEKISEFKQTSFYLWAYALFVTIGQTADYVVSGWHGNIGNVVWLGVISLVICAVQFSLGKAIGGHLGDRIAGGQLLGQKNSAMGIWILNTFLNPVASVAMAFYSIWQNIFNSWQIYAKNRSQE